MKGDYYMSLTKEQIEYLHDRGLMPDMYYYQINGKSFQENYISIHRQRQQQYKKFMEERQQQKELEKHLDTAIEEALEKALGKLLD